MKLFLAIVLIVASSQAYVISDSYAVRNVIDDLVKEALEFIRAQMKKQEPFPVPQFPPLDVKDDLVDLHVDFNDVLVSKASDFTVDKLTNNLIKLTADFQLTVPSIHLDGNYKATGTVEGHKVSGDGKFTIDLAHFVQKGHIKFSLANHEVQIADLTLQYEFDSVQFDLEGLTVEGMTPEQVKEFFNTKFMDFLKNHKDEVASRVAAQVKDKANQLMKGKSLQDIIDWLKHFINPTAAPAIH